MSHKYLSCLMSYAGSQEKYGRYGYMDDASFTSGGLGGTTYTRARERL